jgi:hypothetical protein
MFRLRACYQNAVTDPDLWDASVARYWEDIQKFDAVAVRRAFASAPDQHQNWMPSLGQLKELINSQGTNFKVNALDAWPDVLKLAARSSDEHSDPIARQALKSMGGGRRLGQMPQADLEVWGKKEFLDAYAELATATPAAQNQQLGQREAKAALKEIDQRLDISLPRMDMNNGDG